MEALAVRRDLREVHHWRPRRFVVEDADHLMSLARRATSTCNRFLTIADGGGALGRARKIIFRTILPNVGDLDDALIRPGRCLRAHPRPPR